ncbi:MAG: glycosyltransferase family 1 protein [Pseudomonadota bacterium]
MRILIDGMNLALAQGTGVATYARNLAECVKAGGHDLSILYGKGLPPAKGADGLERVFFSGEDIGRGDIRYHVDLARGLLPERAKLIPDTGAVDRSSLGRSYPGADAYLNIQNLFFKAAAKFQHLGGMLEVTLPRKVDIAHWTYPVPIRVRGAKNVYTFHDLVPVRLPYLTLDLKDYYLPMLRRIARSADHVVTISETSKSDIVNALGVEADKVSNTYQHVEVNEAQIAATRANMNQTLAEIGAGAGQSIDEKGYFLYVGAIEPKKNLRRILDGYLTANVDAPLVVVGRAAWSCEEELRVMKRSAGRIIYLDYVSYEHLLALLLGARALVFASLYEGFGLPVLEAFQMGAPVITADASSTREIVGDAAVLVDPYDIRAMRDAFRGLSAPGADNVLGDLAEKGRKRATAFSREAVSARLEDCYARIAA